MAHVGGRQHEKETPVLLPICCLQQFVTPAVVERSVMSIKESMIKRVSGKYQIRACQPSIRK